MTTDRERDAEGAELAVETGRCPECSGHVGLTPADLGAMRGGIARLCTECGARIESVDDLDDPEDGGGGEV